jgi:hypothetical protein
MIFNKVLNEERFLPFHPGEVLHLLKEGSFSK